MAPKKQETQSSETTNTAVETTKTVPGYAVQLTGFIPIPKDDLRAQAKLTSIMADVDEQVVPFSAIFELIQDRDFRVQPVNRRYTEAQAMAMLKAMSGEVKEAAPEEKAAPDKTPEFDAEGDDVTGD